MKNTSKEAIVLPKFDAAISRRKFIGTTAGTVAAGMLANQLPAVQASGASSEKMNLLFIMTDQQFADAMSCAGNPWVKTPNMDRIAARGTRFNQAYAAQPLCAPCRTSIQTGHWPTENRCTNNDMKRNKVPKRLPMMGACLKEAGYETAYFGKWHVPIKEQTRHGYDIFDVWPIYGADKDQPVKFETFLDERDSSKPFFATVSLHNPHDICQHIRDQELPEGEIEAPLPAVSDRPELPEGFEIPEGYPEMILNFRKTEPAKTKLYPTEDWDEARWRQYFWAYYRLTEKVDHEVGKVMDALEASGQADNTAIIFISDHGEGLGLHHWTQKQALVDTSARIPFIVSIPGQTPGNSVNDDDLISTMDIFPTFCDLGGAKIPESLTGRSLAPLIRRETTEWRDHVVSENEFSFAKRTGLHGRMVRSARYKYSIYVSGENREWLVDMVADPTESTNLVNDPKHAEALAQHRAWIQNWAKEVKDETFPYVA